MNEEDKLLQQLIDNIDEIIHSPLSTEPYLFDEEDPEIRRILNEDTIKAIEDIEKGVNLKIYNDCESIFKQLSEEGVDE